MPPVVPGHLADAQIEVIKDHEKSLSQSTPPTFIQVAPGSGKTAILVNFVYRLVKHAGARRVLVVADTDILRGRTLEAFHRFVTPDDGRKFTELYNIQHLQSTQIDTLSCVTISSIQRLSATLQGKELDPALDEVPGGGIGSIFRDPPQVIYNPEVPIETFDFIIMDGSRRSIYNPWRQVLEYFDAYRIGLTHESHVRGIGNSSLGSSGPRRLCNRTLPRGPRTCENCFVPESLGPLGIARASH
jgi:type I restriction enzyme R subunit